MNFRERNEKKKDNIKYMIFNKLKKYINVFKYYIWFGCFIFIMIIYLYIVYMKNKY